MVLQFNPYMIPSVIAAISSAVLALYIWHRRKPGIPEAVAATVLMLAVTVWSLSCSLEIGVASLAAKIFWAKVKYFGVVAVPLASLSLSLQYTGRKISRRTLSLLAIGPILTLILVWTNDFHGLIWSTIGLEESGGYLFRVTTYGPCFWLHTLYSNLLLLMGGVLIFERILHARDLYRRQAVMIMVIFLAPWSGNLLYITGLNPFGFLDLTPFGIALAGIPMSLGLFRFRLFDLLPVARGALTESMTDLVIVIDAQARIADLNPAAREVIGCSAAQSIGQPLSRILSNWPELEEACRCMTEGNSEIIFCGPQKKSYFDLRISPLRNGRGDFTGRLVVLRDITGRKESEALLRKAHEELEHRVEERTASLLAVNEQLRQEIEDRRRAEKSLKESENKFRDLAERLKHISLHDSLTGLYNRIYFEEEMSRLEKGRDQQVGIVSCDVDGLKLVNDTLGHDQGDKLLAAAARVIKESFREGDLVARMGGDEFSILLSSASESSLESACERIQDSVTDYNAMNPELPLSISTGFAINNGFHRNLKDVFKEADNNMYRKKLYRNQSVRSTIVKALINTLKARDLTTERHVLRSEKLLVRMAALIGLPEERTSDLALAAKFHDIGKVAVSDSILFKKGPLTPEEWTEMKRHCEVGYRIALSAPDLAPIADWILKHHEWWNGQGYPLGMKGEEIPIECRLLAIVDAYEALTSARPYRKAFPYEEAVAELLRCSGTQFDPVLLEKFLEMLKTYPRESTAETMDVLENQL